MFVEDYREWHELDDHEKLKLVKKLKQIVIEVVKGDVYPRQHNSEYSYLHYKIMRAQIDLVPEIVEMCNNAAGLISYLETETKSISDGAEIVNTQFAPLLAVLSSFPGDDPISDAITGLGIDQINKVWSRCLERRTTEPDAAITSARSLVETVCKHIVLEPQDADDEDLDFVVLYKKAVTKLNLHPTQAVDKQYKQLLQGCLSIINPIGTIRNWTADSHGSDPKTVPVSVDEATLIVNIAGSIAMFLLTKWHNEPLKPADNPFGLSF